MVDDEKDVEKICTSINPSLQKENEELQSKVAEIRKRYEEAVKKAEMMQSKLDLVVEEKEEKERLLNETGLALKVKEAASKLMWANNNKTIKLEQHIGSKKAKIKKASIGITPKSDSSKLKEAFIGLQSFIIDETNHWIWLSSATTVFAAASVAAYVAKEH